MRRESNPSTTSVEIASELTCEIDGRPLSICSVSRSIVVEVPDVTTGLSLFRLSSSRGLRLRSLHLLKESLERLNWTLEFRIGPSTIAAIGHQAGNPFWQLVGLPTLSLRPERLIAAWLSKSNKR